MIFRCLARCLRGGHAVYIPPPVRLRLAHLPCLVIMLPRRNSTNPNPGHASPRPTRGSSGGRLPRSLVTNQKTFHADTAQTVETESPRSETFEQGPSVIPSMPPRSGLTRQSAQRIAYEPLSPAVDSPSQSQPPDVMPSATPPQQRPVRSPPTPIPSNRSDSRPPDRDFVDISGGTHANVWPTYNKLSKEVDEKISSKWNEDLGMLLVFVSLVWCIDI